MPHNISNRNKGQQGREGCLPPNQSTWVKSQNAHGRRTNSWELSADLHEHKSMHAFLRVKDKKKPTKDELGDPVVTHRLYWVCNAQVSLGWVFGLQPRLRTATKGPLTKRRFLILSGLSRTKALTQGWACVTAFHDKSEDEAQHTGTAQTAASLWSSWLRKERRPKAIQAQWGVLNRRNTGHWEACPEP